MEKERLAKAESFILEVHELYDEIVDHMGNFKNSDIFLMAVAPMFLKVRGGVVYLELPKEEAENVEKVDGKGEGVPCEACPDKACPVRIVSQ